MPIGYVSQAKDYTLFVAESNKIEGILRKPKIAELEIHEWLVHEPLLNTDSLQKLVSTVQPGALLRDSIGMDVHVGSYIVPPGGPAIKKKLNELLAQAEQLSPYSLHVQYELLHPFMDGNGRSGRALWLWCHAKRGYLPECLKYGFLHLFYYETLRNYQGTK